MNCDRIATSYRFLEYLRFGRKLEQCRFALIPQISSARHALLLGDGDGRFLAAFASVNTSVCIDVVDVSRKMLDVSRSRLQALRVPDPQRIRLHHADLRTFALPANEYDLIVSQFVFDVFADDDVEAIVRRLSGRLARDGIWLVSEFDLPATRWQRAWSELWLRFMYVFFRVVTGLKNQSLPDWRASLRRADFAPAQQIKFQAGFIVSEIWKKTT